MALKNPKSFEWKILYAVTGTIDLIQMFSDFLFTEFFAAPEIINEIIDPIIGTCLGVYFQLRGVSMVKRISRLLSLVAGDFAEQLSVSVAPAWIEIRPAISLIGTNKGRRPCLSVTVS